MADQPTGGEERSKGRGRAPGLGKTGGRAAGLGAIAVIVIAILQAFLDAPTGEGETSSASSSPAVSSDRPPAIIAQSQSTRASASASAPFDYYVLSLSWSPSFCETRPDADQCGRGYRFIVHGLWPQFERGFPTDCDTSHRRPSNALLRRYDHITVSSGLLAYQWRKHGSCSGLDPEGYFEATEQAAQRIRIPPALDAVSKDLDVDPRVIEKAFIDANDGLTRDAVTVKCRDGQLSEVRICLTRDLEPRTCGKDVVRDCGARLMDVPAPD